MLENMVVVVVVQYEMRECGVWREGTAMLTYNY